jgi:hypothetical protein
MKSQSSFTGSSAWLLGRTQSNPADRLLQRVRAVTHELEAIQTEMCSQLADTDGTPRKNGITPDSVAASDLQIFKTMVDQMRRILWFYTGEATADMRIAPGLTESPNSHASALSTQGDDSVIDSGSFFERLNVVIDGYIQTRPTPGSGRSKL